MNQPFCEVFESTCTAELVWFLCYLIIRVSFFTGRSKISNYKELGWICEERWQITYVSDKNQREWSKGVPTYQQWLLLHWQDNDILVWLSTWCQGMYCTAYSGILIDSITSNLIREWML